ncbi:kinesin-like protein KIF12 isoform X4 [Gigantopelta aegis]|uniref:kinesin-like protein KIF12 isoform X4 n=1 Tax=Gigantopelta aegis TaxID=1735272 RepID=UPI001B889E4E|nr:kinesin-like protein KIF12 isoform X4 [Gigantopelta aegis]
MDSQKALKTNNDIRNKEIIMEKEKGIRKLEKKGERKELKEEEEEKEQDDGQVTPTNNQEQEQELARISKENSLNALRSPGFPPVKQSSSGSLLSPAGTPDRSKKQRFSHKPHKNAFGSSTTLSSSATDGGSDDCDDQFNVALRVRPFNSQEKNRHDTFALQFPGDGKVTVDNQGVEHSFYFNSVFAPDATQEDLFEQSGVIHLVDMALNGYACTAMAFGQTGSGKTHTMTGPPQLFLDGLEPNPKMFGLIQRSFRYLYKQLKAIGTNKVLRASYLEVYNEQVIDLLNPSHRRYLAVRWSKNKGFYVENLFQVQCETLDDLMAVLEEGLRNRQTGSHGLNEFSSRSHSMLTVTIDSEYPDPDDENLYITKRGKLSFVDLAGSEKVKDQNLGAGVLSESNSINKSLLVLGNCISHLGDSKRRHGHIPYRDSKLTKLLADSLGGNGVTLMITCITPSSYNVTETMNTLRYASRAKKIKTKPAIKMDPREKLILSLKREIKILRNENHYLRQQLEFPAKPKGQLQKENDEKFMKFIKEQQQKESGLNEMLQEYMVENEALRGENSDLHSTRDRIRREQQLLYRENEKLMKRVEELERVVSQSPSTWQQAAAAHPQYEGYRQSDITSPRMSPAGNPRKASVPPRLPVRTVAQDFPHPDPSRLPGNSPRNALPPGVPPHPMRPPHRLSEPVIRAAPGPYEVVTNGGPDSSGIPQRIGRPIGQGPPNAHIRQISPTRPLDRRVSQVSNSDSIRDMNERLRLEVLELEGEIQQQHQLTQRRSIPRQQQNGTIR